MVHDSEEGQCCEQRYSPHHKHHPALWAPRWSQGNQSYRRWHLPEETRLRVSLPAPSKAVLSITTSRWRPRHSHGSLSPWLPAGSSHPSKPALPGSPQMQTGFRWSSPPPGREGHRSASPCTYCLPASQNYEDSWRKAAQQGGRDVPQVTILLLWVAFC